MKILLVLGSVSLIPLLYLAKSNLALFVLLFIPVIVFLVTFDFLKIDGAEEINSCKDGKVVDSKYIIQLILYVLGALLITNDIGIVLFTYIVFVITWASYEQHFSPIPLLFNYHFYEVETQMGTRILILTRGNIRNWNNISIKNIYRLTDTVYITL